MIKQALLRFLGFYRYWLSPAVHSLAPSGCRYQPTCSHYASEAIQIHGAARGSWLVFRRLMRCHPFGRGGFDPVPLAHGHLADCNEVPAATTARTLQEPLP